MENKKEKGKARRKSLLALFIAFGPALVIFLFSMNKCENNFEVLPIYADMPEYEFTTADGEIINNASQKGRITVFTTIQTSCPSNCAIDLFQFNMGMYQDFRKNSLRFQHVDIISIVTDEEGNPVEEIEDIQYVVEDIVEKYNPDIWKFVSGDPKQVYNIQSNDVNLYEVRTDSAFADKPYLEVLLLSDRDNQLRYVGKGGQEGYIRDFKGKIALLKAQYNHEKMHENDKKK